jgi:hypothetical protein
MDPNAALAEARQAADQVEASGDEGIDVDAAFTLTEKFRALDEWLSRGGFLPADWLH